MPRLRFTWLKSYGSTVGIGNSFLSCFEYDRGGEILFVGKHSQFPYSTTKKEGYKRTTIFPSNRHTLPISAPQNTFAKYILLGTTRLNL